MKKCTIILLFLLASNLVKAQYEYILDSSYNVIICPGGNGVGSMTISVTLADNSVHTLPATPIIEFPEKIIKVSVNQLYISFINCTTPNCNRTTETNINDSNCLTHIQYPSCSGFNISKIDLYKIESLQTLNPTPREICPSKNIVLNVFSCTNPYPYAIEYMYSGIGWTSLIGTGTHGSNYTIKYSDIPNLSGKPNVSFRIKYHTGAVSKPIIYEVLNCSPALDTNISPNPAPSNPTCSYNNDGSFTVIFDRELDDSVSEKMNLQVYKQIDGGTTFDGYESKVLTKSDFTGPSYTWNPKNLPGGIYKLFWQTKSNNGGFDDIGTNPDAYDESSPFTLTAPPVLSVSGTPSPVQCFGGNDGSITVTPNGGTPGTSPLYEYSIDNGISWQEETLFDTLTKGDYTILIKDKNGCESSSAIITVDELFPTIPNVIGVPGSITSPTLINGNNGHIAISVSSGSGNYTNYAWTKDGNPFTPPSGSTNTNIINLYEGVYTIIVTDSNGCSSDIETFTLTDPEPIQITINMTPNTVNCSDTKVNLIASAIGGFLNSGGDYSYLWDDGTSGASLTNVGIGTYQVTVTDDGGNTQNRTFNVNGPNPITVTLANKKELSCRDGNDAAIQLNIQGGTGDYVITWENIVDPNFSALGNELKNVGFGSYVYRVVDQNGCVVTNSSQPIEFTNPPLFSIDLGEDPFFCEGQTVNISATIQDPNASYNWTSDTGFTSTNPEINVDQQGTYTVSVTSGKGCIAQDSITVIENIKEINAEFLYASQVFTNEKFVIIDVTYPIPDQIQWIMPEQATIVMQDQDLIELYFNKPGEYDISMISKLGNCQDTFTQKVLVLQKEITDDQNQNSQNQQLGNIREFSVYPNPSGGKFFVKITLKEQKDISIKVFNLANNAILTHKKQSGKKQYEIPFTLQVPSGVYAVVLETPYGNTIRKVIVY
ncbi:hypothetical protein IWQ47_004612 [Aquimarina sp. EL_43]|uniref:T9SS type A sorting domain-containing protein n=1 Tax=unclassified Aquimarina TaxID=2627091 RepID=UPI0018CB3EA9|nr:MULTISPECIES: T9SS type A sorting domain-containing protein [unclassified Aquimarina]MBG6133204.1 hypothetical protein [Aquimarina sp. EL_35]MBG6153437.1 hypothetical protein [Aquimarina sp. EL_32]MBG6171518.1 hypothetical protein [Aquimarina sp. EL_43]